MIVQLILFCLILPIALSADPPSSAFPSSSAPFSMPSTPYAMPSNTPTMYIPFPVPSGIPGAGASPYGAGGYSIPKAPSYVQPPSLPAMPAIPSYAAPPQYPQAPSGCNPCDSKGGYPTYYGFGQGGGGGGYYGYKPPERESNFKRFLKGASEGLIMGSLGMLTGRR